MATDKQVRNVHKSIAGSSERLGMTLMLASSTFVFGCIALAFLY